MAPITEEADLRALFERCSNWGRWGHDDQLGTLNYITPECRIRGAAEVNTGRSISLAQTLSKHETEKSFRPIVHFMAYDSHTPRSAVDFIGMIPHGIAVTHLDAIGHCFFEGILYNGRTATETVNKNDGLRALTILVQRQGIVTRGVLLDIAAARGTEWLEAGDYVTPEDLDAAEALAGTTVQTGDVVILNVGVEARERASGPEDISLRAGLDAASIEWLHQREISVYTGDCIERIPYPSPVMPMPLHQIGLASMGLILLDCPLMTPFLELSRELGRSTFLFTAAPWVVPGGTGSPVNPLAVF